MAGYTHNEGFSSKSNGYAVGKAGSESTAIAQDGTLYQKKVEVTATATQLNKLVTKNTITALDGSTGKKACSTNGVSSIAGGTGIADMTLAAPTAGDEATIRIDTISSGDVVVTCADGVTVDGTNDIMTFNAVGEALVLAYKSATEWQIVLNIGAVALSATA